MKPTLTVACFFLKSAWQAFCRPSFNHLRRPSSLRSGSLRSAITALLLTPLSAHSDLVAHFRFDNDLKDVTGQHDGRPVDPELAPAFAPGRVGNAVVIEKVNAGIEPPLSPAFRWGGCGRVEKAIPYQELCLWI